MIIFLLSCVEGSKSAVGGKNPLVNLDPGGPNPLGHRHNRQNRVLQITITKLFCFHVLFV